MGSCDLIFALTFARKLVIFVVPLSSVRFARPRVEPFIDIGPNPGQYIFGTREEGDRLIFQNFIYLEAKIGRILKYRETIHTPYEETITQVDLHSWLGRWSTGERVQVTEYGPGYRNVTLAFYGKRGHAINFAVTLYGL
ncbi:probable salivary secreted peptide [Belonocnema kinseyi]|uniref:probable salivary secreted peptide n=1 Tax=Belonocnema kinseyi TaxID=2817044 RepID=UPI00143DCB7F|nr:probable salivary secreted peptide [Belonocnema kinseyi]